MPHDQTAVDLLDEFQYLKERRRNWEEVWEEIADNLLPHRSGFDETPREKGTRRDSIVYDGSPLSALNMYAAGCQGYLLSSSFKWFGLRVPEEGLMDNRDVRLWLSVVEQVLYGTIQRSNFYKQMFELFRDGGAFGTATLYTYFDEATGRAWFLNRHPKEIYLAEDDNDEVDTVFRYYWMTKKRIVERFKNDTLDDELREEADDSDEKYKEIPVLHVVKPRVGWDPDKSDKKSKRFASFYVDVEHEVTMRESGYDIIPYGTWRVEKNSDEEYGRGPGWNALGDIKALYRYVKTDLHATQMATDPPIDIPKERKGDIRFVPGGKNYYKDSGRDVKLMGDPNSAAARLRIGLDREERKQRIIEKHFMVDFFMMMAQADKTMTATEIRERREEKAVMLGPHVTGLNQDVLDKIIDRLFRDLWDAGMIPQPPEILTKAGSGKIEVDYMGPLAQAQRSYFKTEPYRQSVGDIMAVAQLRPDILDNYDWDFISREMSHGHGMPEQGMLEPRVRDGIRQQRAQAQQRQEQAALLEAAGKANQGLSKGAEPGSPAEAMAKQAVPTGAGGTGGPA